MKKVISVILAVLLIAVACVPAFAADQDFSVVLTSDKELAKAGDTITVTLRAGTDLSSIKAIVNYDVNYFELQTAELGDKMNDISHISKPGDKILDVDLKDTGKTIAAGEVHIAGVMGRKFAEDNTVAKMTFKVLKGGSAITAKVTQAIDNSADPGVELNVDDIPALKAGASVTVKGDGSVATPATTTKKASNNTNATTAKSNATTAKNASVSIPKTGGTVSVVACSAAVLAMAAAVAVTMKKKNDND